MIADDSKLYMIPRSEVFNVEAANLTHTLSINVLINAETATHPGSNDPDDFVISIPIKIATIKVELNTSDKTIFPDIGFYPYRM